MWDYDDSILWWSQAVFLVLLACFLFTVCFVGTIFALSPVLCLWVLTHDQLAVQRLQKLKVQKGWHSAAKCSYLLSVCHYKPEVLIVAFCSNHYLEGKDELPLLLEWRCWCQPMKAQDCRVNGAWVRSLVNFTVNRWNFKSRIPDVHRVSSS